ncbi:MAG: hypothetical protein WB760_29385 [Xanthobacteraceae bacterium]
MAVPSSEESRTYDICFFLPGQSAFHRLDSGVVLGKDTIAWTQDDRTSETPLSNIVAVHLSSAGQRTVVDRCAITFSDNTVLTIVNSDPGGFRDSEQAATYRAFVQDLHARLASSSYGAIRFTAGWTPWRYQAMLSVAFAGAAASVISGIVFYLLLGDLRGPAIVILGAIACWRLERTTRANAPRDYTPDNLPAALMS